LITRVCIGWTSFTATAAPTARHIAGIGIGRPKRAPATRDTSAIARFIAGVGIGFTAAPLFRGRAILARQAGFIGGGRFPPLRQSTTDRHGKTRASQAQNQQAAPQGRIGGVRHNVLLAQTSLIWADPWRFASRRG
jgi:hypothetical protein